MMDAASGGSINNKTPEEAYELIDVMASNNYEKILDWNMMKKVDGLIDLDKVTSLKDTIEKTKKSLGKSTELLKTRCHCKLPK